MKVDTRLGELLYTDALLIRKVGPRDLDAGLHDPDAEHAKRELRSCMQLWLHQNQRNGWPPRADVVRDLHFRVRSRYVEVRRNLGDQDVIHFEVEKASDDEYWLVEHADASARP